MSRTSNASAQTRRLLAELAQQPQAWRYGYELIKITGLKSGTLYPTLARLSEQGLLESEWRASLEPGRPPRHAYRLTASGAAFAQAQAARPARVAKSNPQVTA
jgi:DNA-binding PadR family transcriptional regulator